MSSRLLDYATRLQHLRYSHYSGSQLETWEQLSRRVCYYIVGAGAPPSIKLPKSIAREIEQAHIERKFVFGGRILAQTGRDYHQTDNCFCLQAINTREGWGQLAHDATVMFMSGGGVGCDYSDISPYGTPLKRSGGIASGPIPLIKLIDAAAEAARQGGERRGANYASLSADHPDIPLFIPLKNGGGLDHTNISVRFNKKTLADHPDVFKKTLHHACKYGDPGFQFDWDDSIFRNACTEIIAKHPYESCCLGHIVLPNIKNTQELSDISQLATIALLCATEYTMVPIPQVRTIKEQNRRLGLGFMGLAEWLLLNNFRYEYNTYLDSWLNVWKHASNNAADKWSNELSLARPIAVRAVAPTGTVSIVGGLTTPGIEPIFHQAYKRTYNTLKTQEYQDGYATEIVIDRIVDKLLEQGVNVNDIDTAYTLSQTSEGLKRRLGMQANIQRHVDNAISSTINLPAYKEGIEDIIAPILLNYLPMLRGVTFYPDGARDNQPIQPVDLKDALKSHTLYTPDSCRSGVCGV